MKTLQTEVTTQAFTVIRNLTVEGGIYARQTDEDRLDAAHTLADAMHNFDPTDEVTLPMVKRLLTELDDRFPFCLDHAPFLRAFAREWGKKAIKQLS